MNQFDNFMTVSYVIVSLLILVWIIWAFIKYHRENHKTTEK